MMKLFFAALFCSAAVLVSGCSSTTVNAEHDPRGQMSLAFDLGTPGNRMEQIIYEEVAPRFWVTKAPNTPELEIAARSRTTGSGSTRANSDQVTIKAIATVTYKGNVIFTATRQAAAGFSKTSLQALSDVTRRQDAEDRAATAVAKSLSLDILARFPTHEFHK